MPDKYIPVGSFDTIRISVEYGPTVFLLGVSQSMVSRLLAGNRSISPELTRIMTEVGVINNNMAGGV